MDAAPIGFSYEHGWRTPRILVVRYAGVLPADASHVRRTERMLAAGPARVALAYDVRELRRFPSSHVPLHGDMFSRLRDRIAGVALVGAGPAARFAAVTAGLMSRVPIQTFDEEAAALAWLASLVS